MGRTRRNRAARARSAEVRSAARSRSGWRGPGHESSEQAERGPGERARSAARQRPDQRPEQHDPPDPDPNLVVDQGVVAAAVETEVGDESEAEQPDQYGAPVDSTGISPCSGARPNRNCLHLVYYRRGEQRSRRRSYSATRAIEDAQAQSDRLRGCVSHSRRLQRRSRSRRQALGGQPVHRDHPTAKGTGTTKKPASGGTATGNALPSNTAVAPGRGPVRGGGRRRRGHRAGAAGGAGNEWQEHWQQQWKGSGKGGPRSRSAGDQVLASRAQRGRAEATDPPIRG